jgi:hypothetical protein
MDGGTENMKNLAQFGANTHDCCKESPSYIEFHVEQVSQTAEWRGNQPGSIVSSTGIVHMPLAREHQDVIAGIILDTRSNTEVII